MRRVAIILCLVLAGAVVLGASSAAGGDDDGTYQVRAAFDNAAFLVTGEDVRVAGAKVGEVSEVLVSTTDETVSCPDVQARLEGRCFEEGGRPEPGKAIVVMTIDDPGFEDWLTDASCLIRPQSLLGEKFVECKTTEPRAAGTPPPPALEEVPDGEPGAGQHLLPLESNGKAVDFDLVLDIQRLPFAQRFRLILNELGITLAARGEELEEIVLRANPALRETDRVLEILARQNRALADLATDSDAILSALARERTRVTGFIEHAAETAEASAEERVALEEGLALFPEALREIRATMGELESFNAAAGPVLGTLGAAAPSLTRATVALGPFARSATPALTSLGDAAEGAGPLLAAADPVLIQLRDLAEATRPAAVGLQDLLSSLRTTQGFEELMDFFFYSAGTINGFDQYGHFLRALLIITNCNDYEVVPIGGCGANFTSPFVSSATASEPSSEASSEISDALKDFLFEEGGGSPGSDQTDTPEDGGVSPDTGGIGVGEEAGP